MKNLCKILILIGTLTVIAAFDGYDDYSDNIQENETVIDSLNTGYDGNIATTELSMSKIESGSEMSEIQKNMEMELKFVEESKANRKIMKTMFRKMKDLASEIQTNRVILNDLKKEVSISENLKQSLADDTGKIRTVLSLISSKIMKMSNKTEETNIKCVELERSIMNITDSRKIQMEYPDQNIILVRFNNSIEKFEMERQDFNKIVNSLAQFKVDFERELHNNQMRYWLKLVNAVDRLDSIALDIEETIAPSWKQEPSQIPSILNKTISMNPPVLGDNTFINAGEFDVDMKPLEIESTNPTSSHGLDDNALAEQGALLNEPQSFDLFSSNSENRGDEFDELLELFKDFNEDPSKMNSIDNGTTLQLSGNDSTMFVSRSNHTDALTDGLEETAMLDKFPNKGGNSEVFKPEELQKERNKRTHSMNQESKFFNLPYGSQPRVSFEMQHLSDFMEQGLKKTDSLEKKVTEQMEVGRLMGKVLESIKKDTESKSLIEIGFFVACGFLFGVVIGIISTVSVVLCLRPYFRKNDIDSSAQSNKYRSRILSAPELYMENE